MVVSSIRDYAKKSLRVMRICVVYVRSITVNHDDDDNRILFRIIYLLQLQKVHECMAHAHTEQVINRLILFVFIRAYRV